MTQVLLEPAVETGRATHARWVRASHWIVAISMLTLASTGVIILMAHPRLYWGEVGNDLTPALIELPISRNYKHGGWENRIPFFQDSSSPITRESDVRHLQSERVGPKPAFSRGLVAGRSRRGAICWPESVSGHFRSHI